MNFNHKPEISFHVFLVLLLFFMVGSFMVSNGATAYADDQEGPEKISQQVQVLEMTPQQIKDIETIIIDNKGYKKDRKGPSKFEHVKHAREYQISCYECHHEYKDEEKTEQVTKAEETVTAEEPEQAEETEKTVENEESVKSEKTEEPKPKELTEQNIWSPWTKSKKCIECHDPIEKKNDVIKLQAAYHKNCKNCHKEKKIFGDDFFAYRNCTKCHIEENSTE